MSTSGRSLKALTSATPAFMVSVLLAPAGQQWAGSSARGGVGAQQDGHRGAVHPEGGRQHAGARARARWQPRSPSSTAPRKSKIDATTTACQYLRALADTEVPKALAWEARREGGSREGRVGQGIGVQSGWADGHRPGRATSLPLLPARAQAHQVIGADAVGLGKANDHGDREDPCVLRVGRGRAGGSLQWRAGEKRRARPPPPPAPAAGTAARKGRLRLWQASRWPGNACSAACDYTRPPRRRRGRE